MRNKRGKRKKRRREAKTPPIHFNAIVNYFNGFTSDGSLGARLDWQTPAFTVPW